jgi:hypothetical protein
MAPVFASPFHGRASLRCARWVLVPACALSSVVLTAAVPAQLFEPSTVASAGPVHAYKALPVAWLRLAMRFGLPRSGEASSRATTIELALPAGTDERVIASVRIASALELESVTAGGKLTFRDVPTQLPMQLRVSVWLSDGAPVCTNARTYVLHFPEQARIRGIGLVRSLEESGYLGDVVVDQMNANVTSCAQLGDGRIEKAG